MPSLPEVAVLRLRYISNSGTSPKVLGSSNFIIVHYNRYSDKAHITTGNSDGKNIWGVEEFQFQPFYCGRSIKTFTQGPTAFIANKNGPVRGIRSLVGANSGMLTQRDEIMYEQKQEQTTFWRVHSIPGAFLYNNFNVSYRSLISSYFLSR